MGLEATEENIDYSEIQFYDLDKFNLSKKGIDSFLNFAKYLKDINFDGNPISQIIKFSNDDKLFDNFINKYIESEHYNKKLDEDDLEDLIYEFKKQGLIINTNEYIENTFSNSNNDTVYGLKLDVYFTKDFSIKNN